MSGETLQEPDKTRTRVASVSGVLRHHRPGVAFHGRINLDLRSDCVYYLWQIEADGGEFLSSLGRPVSLRVMPEGQDPFEFALAHAVEGIKRYRFGRSKPFDVQNLYWISF